MRGRQHINPLGLSFEEFRGEPPQLRPHTPVEIEIGCADAQFLFERAAANPDRSYLGFEVRRFLVDEVNARAAAEHASVQSVFCNANLHMRRLLAPRSVTRVYVNFPDPWFKNRHRKRRMVDAGLVRDIHAVCVPGAEVFFQSDVWEVALDALDLFERADALFENRAGAWSFWKGGNLYGARSWREQHCEEQGMRIWRMLYVTR